MHINVYRKAHCNLLIFVCTLLQLRNYSCPLTPYWSTHTICS